MAPVAARQAGESGEPLLNMASSVKPLEDGSTSSEVLAVEQSYQNPSHSSQTDTRMPFSSPMGVEILSPTSPNIQYSPRSRRKASKGSMAENTTTRTRRFSVQKTTKEDSLRKESKSPNRTRWPELNVVTNFSKPPILAKRAVDPGNRQTGNASAYTQNQGADNSATQRQIHAGLGPGGNGSKDSSTDAGRRRRGNADEMKNMPDRYDGAKGMTEDAAGLGMQPFDEGGTMLFSAKGTKGPINHLKRASSRATELSPSDRMVAIGITVTPTSLADRTTSPNGRENSSGEVVQQYALARGSPAAPSITVTPAKDAAPWATPSQKYVAYHPRPASSVYSQANYRGRAATQPSAIPPVPLFPDSSNYSMQRNASEPFINQSPDTSQSRVVSGCTVFEDDECRPTSLGDGVCFREPQLRILTRSSLESIATKHRSQGWWNYIMSPFSAKPSGEFKFPAEEVEGAALNSPHSSEATRIGDDTENASLHKKDNFSPVASLPGGSGSSHTSIATDSDESDAERGEIGLAIDHTPRASDIVRNWPREIIGPDLSELQLSPEGFGTAAEYYQACWHDQNSPTPYLECQNHICLPSSNAGATNPRGLDGKRGLRDIEEEPEDTTASWSRKSLGLESPNSESPEKLKPTVFQQTPANRFSAAFKEEVSRTASKRRPPSEDTVIEDVDTTPAIEEAQVAPVVRAVAPIPAPGVQPAEDMQSSRGVVLTTHPSTAPTPDQSIGGISKRSKSGLPRTAEEYPRGSVRSALPAGEAIPKPVAPTVEERPVKRFVAVMPPDHPRAVPKSSLPAESGSPSTRQEIAEGSRSIPIAEAAPSNDNRPVYIVNHYHGNYQPPQPAEQTATTDFYPPPRATPMLNEKQEVKTASKDSPRAAKKPRSCLKLRKRSNSKEPKKKKKRCLLIAIAIGLLLLIILILALALTLTRKGDKMPVQTQWLNISGFPPIPTGISTIIQPDASQEQSGCVSPTTLWSCALPKEQQASVSPNNFDQPNFRVEIRFQNGTNASLGMNATLTKRSELRASNAVSAGDLVRRSLLRLRDSLSDSLFTPSPAPPSLEDQAFLGNSTDKTTAPFAGEFTPFFMSFQSAEKLPASRLLKRAPRTNETDTTDPFPDLPKGIPPPQVNPDGTAAPAALLPYPSAQPLRLFNRGLPTEHYGFYTYFDRSIFLKSTALVDNTQNTGEVPDDEDGGSLESAATVRCTWAQTRFLVQIWTNKGGTASLLASSNSSASETRDQNPKNLTASSANDFNRPGSFPYPISITLDRHGGDIDTKMIYCYGIDDREHIISDQKKVQLEDRAFGGHLINPALGPFGNVNVSTSEGGPGGIDGGTGGCSCLWKNWNGAES